MKHFIRSLLGKVIIFLAFIISFITLFGSICAIYSYNEPDIDWYTASEEICVRQVLSSEYDILSTRQVAAIAHMAYNLRYTIYGIVIAALLATILFFVALMASSGRRNNTDEIVLTPFCRIPYDLLLVAAFFIMLFPFYFVDTCLEGLVQVFSGILLAIVCMVVATLLCMVAATNIKRKMFFKNTLVYMTLRFIARTAKKLFGLIRYIPMVWKTVLAVACVSFFELLAIIAFDGEQEELVCCFFFVKFLTIPVIMYIALTLKKLQTAGRALAGGNLTYHTDTSKMVWDLKEHGENLNNIAVGMTRAVDERMRSERMKTELITNVSHDIKTPLTSIINYATIIGDGLKDNPEMAEYTEVLVRQSDKLKRLIEDLVEASKASTGNLEVALAPCDASIFLTQAGGEYEEKLEKAQLTLITKTPSEELRIMADGRRMWRIFDNLMNNICKYSLPGTRVYLSLERMGNYAVITFKNTSKEPLDMTEAELMERFTRGDSSRSTEGNGLGLSIAKSLAELQNGRLNIALDGDLFKAVLSFPLVID